MCFRERSRPPWKTLILVAVAAFAFFAATGLLGATPQRLVWVVAGYVVFAAYFSLVIIRIEDGVVSWAVPVGGPQIEVEGLVAIRILSGRALRSARWRFYRSRNAHAPAWNSPAVQLVTESESGERVEYLVAVDDLDGFLACIGRPEIVTEQTEVPVPI